MLKVLVLLIVASMLSAETMVRFQEMFSLTDSVEAPVVHTWFERHVLSDADAAGLVEALLASTSFDPATSKFRIFRWACLYNHTEAVELLMLDGRVDVFAQNTFGLRMAIKKNRKIVDLVGEKNPMAREKIGELVQEVFKEACHHGQLEVIAYVLEDPRLLEKKIHDAIAEMTFIDTFCAFTMFSWMDQHKMSMENVHDVVNLVVNHPKYNIADRENRIFRWFCAYGDVAMVKKLLKDPRVDPGAKDSVALYLAKYDEEMTKILLEDGRVDPIVAAEKYPPGKIFVEQ